MPHLAQKFRLPRPPMGTGIRPGGSQMTLLDLVAAVVDSADTDEEVLATVEHLIDSGQVTLVGQFRNVDLLPD